MYNYYCYYCKGFVPGRLTTGLDPYRLDGSTGLKMVPRLEVSGAHSPELERRRIGALSVRRSIGTLLVSGNRGGLIEAELRRSYCKAKD